jgi:hypothetical protein
MSARDSLIRIMSAAFPQLVYGYPRTYIVATVYPRGTALVDLVPPPDATYLPELRRVPVWTLGGGVTHPVVGAELVVIFRDADKRRPIAFALAPGPVQHVDLGGGAAPVARVGDLCGRLIFDAGALTLYYSAGNNPPGVPAAYVAVAPNPTTPTPPSSIAPGTPIEITTGSDIVGAG